MQENQQPTASPEAHKTTQVLMSWSSGKDSAFALHEISRDPRYQAVGLLTSVNEAFDRVSMHGVQKKVLHAQARALGLPLHEVILPEYCSNDEYDAIMSEKVTALSAVGLKDYVFGDLYLEDIRKYREDRLAPLGLTAHFPLWGRPTDKLAREMIAAGLVAHVVCLDPKKLPTDLIGAQFDEDFLSALPEDVDPCGENGEFHTVVSYAPNFKAPLNLVKGEIVERDGLVFQDFKL